MRKRRRFKQSTSFGDRRAAFAKEVREKASHLKPGLEREDMLKKARQADMASQFDNWASSPELPPTAKDASENNTRPDYP